MIIYYQWTNNKLNLTFNNTTTNNNNDGDDDNKSVYECMYEWVCVCVRTCAYMHVCEGIYVWKYM